MSDGKKVTIQLMTTSGCHLCDEAMQMVHYVINNYPEIGGHIDLELVEISLDDRLVDEYGLRIPVLRKNNTESVVSELGWPFGLDELQIWLEGLT